MKIAASTKTVDLKWFGKLTYKQIFGVVIAFLFAVTLTLLGFGVSCSCFGALIIAVMLFMLPRSLGVENVKIMTTVGVIFLVTVVLIGGLFMAPGFVEQNQGDPDVSENDFFSSVQYEFPGGGVDVTATLESGVDMTGKGVYFQYGAVQGVGFGGVVTGRMSEAVKLTLTGNSATGSVTLDPNTLFAGYVVIKNDTDPDNITAVDGSRTFSSFLTDAFEGSITNLTLYGCFMGAIFIFMLFLTIMVLSNFMRLRMEKTRMRMEKEGRLYPQGHGRCSQCNSIVLPGEVTCRKCGAYIDRPDEMKPDKKDFFECTDCGAEVPEDAKVCPKCGAAFDEEEFEVVHADGKVDTSNEMRACPECGQYGPANTTFCVRCGAKFSKFGKK